MNTAAESVVQPVYLIDNRATLVIEAGTGRLSLSPADALDLIKFIERTGYQAQATSMVKGGAQ